MVSKLCVHSYSPAACSSLISGSIPFSFVGCGYTVGLIENVPAVLPRISAIMLEQFEADSFQS